MQNSTFFLPESLRKTVRQWLWLMVLSVGAAGVYSILLVLGRAPVFGGNFLGVKDFFSIALVAHVDLSVLIWFVGMGMFIVALNTMRASAHWLAGFSAKAVWLCVAASAVCMALAPWTNPAGAIKSNYVPVLLTPVFFISIGFLASAMLLAVLQAFLKDWLPARESAKPLLGIPAATWEVLSYSIGAILLLTLIAMAWSAAQVPSNFGVEIYFEQLFWGAGHILQFAYTQLSMFVWLVLAAALGWQDFVQHRAVRSLLWLNLAVAFVGMAGYLNYPVNSPEFASFFTDHMRHFGGLACGVMAVWLLVLMAKNFDSADRAPVAWTGLLVSLLLLGFGGGLGYAIQGINVTIPAHYHGAIVAITLACMAVIYTLLPALNTGFSLSAKWPCRQLWVYTIGQFMHVGGLAVSGGYGVLRKTPGGLDAMPQQVKIAMGFMGLGGLVAIIGGIMFVVITFRALRK